MPPETGAGGGRQDERWRTLGSPIGRHRTLCSGSRRGRGRRLPLGAAFAHELQNWQADIASSSPGEMASVISDPPSLPPMQFAQLLPLLPFEAGFAEAVLSALAVVVAAARGEQAVAFRDPGETGNQLIGLASPGL